MAAAQTANEDTPLARLLTGVEAAQSADAQIETILRIARAHLDMDVGFVSEFAGGRRYFRHVNTRDQAAPVRVGDSHPLEEGYCQRVVDGRLPQLMGDAASFPEALNLPVTRALPVGAHMSVPLVLADGQLYGTFCCFSFAPDNSLNERDLKMLRAFAALTAELIQGERDQRRDHETSRAEVEAILRDRAIEMVFQPIYRLRDDRLVGFEALARFVGGRAPDLWFKAADRVGLGVELEHLAVARAIESLPDIPSGVSMAINLSPHSVMHPGLDPIFSGVPLNRLVLEITEHAVVENYAALAARLAPWRAAGLRVAVDDAGAGHSSLRHVLDLKPNIIKLDKSLTENLGHDQARRALATALTTFGHAIGSEIVAEGVEVISELRALQAIGVTKVQGFLLSRPVNAEMLPQIAVHGAIAGVCDLALVPTA